MNQPFMSEREKAILRELEFKTKISVTDLAVKLNVTPETIRKDLRVLEEQQKLRRIRGGAVAYAGISSEPPFLRKVSIAHFQKKLIGETAAAFIRDGETIVLAAGSTTLHLARSIKDVKNVTIVTNSLAAAETLKSRLECGLFNGKVIVLGGTSNPRQRSTSGSITNQLLGHFYFDKAFISCGGVSMEGICGFDVDEASATSIMMKKSQQVFLVADSSKFNQRALFHIDSLAAIDIVIADQDKPEQWSKDIRIRDLGWINASKHGEIPIF
ncbi:DeoR/GlpR family DNA-binding transcription regulator [Bacillus sp. FJAT-27251]|uniref:DeoR/GlpR family DNA-binding transcription regulator n=1 Tax=Bacillus sp. FJAT-27251 TaxID=1684142 RepID=UPI0006A77734|nr:DeoR/GlpR family DNA-binding transcription regulator [Bacillus sp. FJAT-27251]